MLLQVKITIGVLDDLSAQSSFPTSTCCKSSRDSGQIAHGKQGQSGSDSSVYFICDPTLPLEPSKTNHTLSI